jgi:ariadne-1
MDDDSFNDYDDAEADDFNEDFDDSDSAGQPQISSAASQAQTAGSYVVESLPSVASYLASQLSELSDFLSCSPGAAGLLLRHFGWNRERLMTNYTAQTDTSILIRAAGIENWHLADSEDRVRSLAASADTSSSSSDSVDCPICDDSYPVSNLVTPDGVHRFCVDCMREYLKSATGDSAKSVQCRCPYHGCKHCVPDYFFSALLPSVDAARQQKFILNSFIQASPIHRFCQGPGCEQVIRALNGSESVLLTVNCSCGFSFCWRCSVEAHEPARCDQLQVWNQKCKKESETAHWIIVNTKRCPKCGVRIEKNQG